jgi:hypothetical protein
MFEHAKESREERRREEEMCLQETSDDEIKTRRTASEKMKRRKSLQATTCFVMSTEPQACSLSFVFFPRPSDISSSSGGSGLRMTRTRLL